MKKQNINYPGQMSLFELLSGLTGKAEEKIADLTSEDWSAILKVVTQYGAKKKQEEIEEEKRRQAEIEAEKLRQAEEEQRKHDEHVSEVTSMDLPLDWNNLYSADERAAGVHTDSISDGLILSLTNLGAVDIEYIAQISGYTCKEVITALKGAIYQNPERWDACFYKGWETADEYLSGNLMRKYKAAKEANEFYNGYFDDNLSIIEMVLPEPIPADEIYVTLGSPWVPPDVIDDFIVYLLNKCEFYDYYRRQYVPCFEEYPVEYEPVSCVWHIPEKNRYRRNVRSIRTYGTERMHALHIIEKTLNLKSLQVYDTVPSLTAASGEKRILNKDETAAAQEKQQKIIAKFREWVWTDESRKERLKTIYESNFCSVRRRIFDGGFLSIPGMSPEVTLYPYQKDAVARILFTPNTLLAHDVGAGKTYIMIAAGMEMRRMGISRKNIYVVPNNIVGQWSSLFYQLYPQANLLVVEPKSFAPNKREGVLKAIKDGDFDAIIIAYSCFEMIPMSKSYYEWELDAELEIIEKALKENRNNSRLKKRRSVLEKKLSDIREAMLGNVPDICFDDLGINTLFLDEAHNYKNISIDTKIDRVLGISSSGSAKCNEMLDKVHCVQRANNGRGAIFATGTPITNSVTDIFVMQTYLQYGELKFLDLHHFDNWAATFGEKSTEFEIDVDTGAFRLATRFSRFHNLPELTNLLAQIADFHKVDESNELPEFDGYNDKLISKTAGLADYLIEISERAEAIRAGLVNRTDDNMLKLTTDGRKAALDMRLAEPNTAFSHDSKVFRCMENVLNIYKATAGQRLTQLVFCDISTPKSGFNIYDELKNLLVQYGASKDDIAFVHDYDTELRRGKLFARIQSGEVRVLLGSTFKLGMGVNVQKKLVAIHHLDVPWRPADMVQREGRILRPGNENKEIQIFRYITDGSFDAYSWQLLESKQRFICQLLSGSVTERSAADVDDVVLNYAEIKALAIGNPLIKERVETANEIKRVSAIQRKLVESQSAMKQELFEIPGKTAHAESLIEKAQADIERFDANRIEISEMEGHRKYGATILDALSKHVLQERKTLLTYQGFDIVLPENMLSEKPFVWIEGSGRYSVETGDSDIGCINRIDNKLKGLPEFIEMQRHKQQELADRKADIEAELRKDYGYVSRIEQLHEKLQKLDKKLGVAVI